MHGFVIFAKNLIKMKKILMLLLTVGLIACNSDDDSNDTATITTNYFPTSTNSTWTYSNTDQNGDTEDTMFVNGTEQTNGNTYTNLDTEAAASGFMVGVLTNNLVRRDGGQLIINGELSAPIEGFPEISIPLNDVVLYNANVASGETLSTLSDNFTETIMEIPLTFEYTTTSIQGAALATYTSGTETYTDVIRSRIVLNLSVSTSIVIGATTLVVPILSAQDVLVVDNYYAADTGLVFSEATIDYQLEDISTTGIELPIPESDNQISTATLASFSIGN